MLCDEHFSPFPDIIKESRQILPRFAYTSSSHILIVSHVALRVKSHSSGPAIQALVSRTCRRPVFAFERLIDPLVGFTFANIALAHLTLGDPPEAALEMAKSATEWARKMPMLVGMIYGLAFQGLALSKLGRHDEAIAAIDEAVRHLEGARPEGAEHVHRWRAEILTTAWRAAEAKTAAKRAAAEIDVKAAKLRDPELRRHFLASRQRAV